MAPGNDPRRDGRPGGNACNRLNVEAILCYHRRASRSVSDERFTPLVENWMKDERKGAGTPLVAGTTSGCALRDFSSGPGLFQRPPGFSAGIGAIRSKVHSVRLLIAMRVRLYGWRAFLKMRRKLR